MSLNLGLDYPEFPLKMGKPSDQCIYEFGKFRLDAAHMMLERDGEELDLPRKAVETLHALVSRRGEILSKEELLDTVWADRIVDESNLFFYLSTLRKTLGTQAGGKPWLQTLRGRGYRFNGEVRVSSPENPSDQHDGADRHLVPASDDAITLPEKDQRRRRANLYWLLLPATLALTLIVLAVGSYSHFFAKRSIKSIAIMPFGNDSPELEYLAEGMPERLIAGLKTIRDLDVKSNSRMLRFKGTDLDAATVGRQLNVEAVLASRVALRGDDVTLYLELVDSKTENNLWQKAYTYKVSELGALQRAVTKDLVTELNLDLTKSAEQRIAKQSSDDGEANRLYQHGVVLIRKLKAPQIREGISYLRQATARDPSYAPAYTMIASGVRGLILCCDAHPSEQGEAMIAARRAIELDDGLGEAHSALAACLWQYEWNYEEAESEFRKALDLDPESAMSHFLYGDFLARRGRFTEAGAELQRAAEIEPDSPFFNAFALFSGDPDLALERAKYAIDLDPNFYFSHLMAGTLYRSRGMNIEAEAEFRRAKELLPDQTWSDVNLTGLLVDTGRIDEAKGMLNELIDRSRSRFVPPFHIATIYSQLGETENALLWLEKAYQLHDPKITAVGTNPAWKKLQDDPRLQDLKRRIGTQ